MRTLVAELEKRPDVTLKRGSKHLKVMDSDGRQLTVISRGANDNKGRDAYNVIATLKRHGIDLKENGVASTSRKNLGASPDRVQAVRAEALAVMEMTGLNRHRLADKLYRIQDEVIVGGNKFKSQPSMRDAVYRITGDDETKVKLSPWGAEIFEMGLKAIVDEYQALTVAAEQITAAPPAPEPDGDVTDYYHGKPVIQRITVDGIVRASWRELEAARLSIEGVRATGAAYTSTVAYPHGRGSRWPGHGRHGRPAATL